MFFTLEDQLNHKHPLYFLANEIDWEKFEDKFKSLYSQENGRPCVPIRRMVGLHEVYAGDISLWWRVLTQQKNDKNKVYSIHEPEVQCIRQGKEHKKYEFGNKVSVVRTVGGLIIGAMSFRNEYDGHTIDPALQQVERLTGRRLKVLAGDRGYKGKKMSGTPRVVIPDTPKATDSYYKRRKKHDLFCKRAGIEPVIGHLKSDHRLSRNFYKGVFGDEINIMLSAAAFNFKRAMKLLLRFIFGWIYRCDEGVDVDIRVINLQGEFAFE